MKFICSSQKFRYTNNLDGKINQVVVKVKYSVLLRHSLFFVRYSAVQASHTRTAIFC
jgi:hypothetical protein